MDIPATKKGAIGCAVDVGQLSGTMTSTSGADGRDPTIETGELFAYKRHVCGISVGWRLICSGKVES